MREIPNMEAITITKNSRIGMVHKISMAKSNIFDRGNEFLGEFPCMVECDYGIKRKPPTTRNPQANSILQKKIIKLY